MRVQQVVAAFQGSHMELSTERSLHETRCLGLRPAIFYLPYMNLPRLAVAGVAGRGRAAIHARLSGPRGYHDVPRAPHALYYSLDFTRTCVAQQDVRVHDRRGHHAATNAHSTATVRGSSHPGVVQA